MEARSPEEICRLFKQSMAEGDIESLLSLYDPEAVFLDQKGEIAKGREGLRTQLGQLAGAKTRFHFDIKQVIQAGDIALMHTEWNVFSPQPMHVYAVEVARRQRDGSWRWLIGDPFTVSKHATLRPSNKRDEAA